MKLWFKKQQPDKLPQAAERVEPTPETVKTSEVKPGVALAVALTGRGIAVSGASGAVTKPSAPVSAPANPAEQKSSGISDERAGGFKSDHRSLYKQLLGGLYDAVLVTDPKGHVIDINARVTEFFNYTREETWDLPIKELIPGVNTALISRIREGLSGERFVLIDGRCVRRDRSTFAAEIAISAIDLMNDGDMVFSIRNVERRHVQMQKLKSCQNLLNHVPSAAAACDTEANIKVVNSALVKLLGYAKVEDLHDKPFSLVWKEAGSRDAIQRVLAGKPWRETVQMDKASGMRIQLTLSLSPELDIRGKVIGFLAAFSPAAVVALEGPASKGV